VLKEQPDGGHKVSLRSKGATDVGAIATHFGGGGHAFAAGFTSEDGLEATVAALVDVLAGRGAAGEQLAAHSLAAAQGRR
jgi:bifunctional oligoribonuclease and PAP phosphatase NrnA